jgi:orotate phosphoribosyltransferase-like protein
MRHGRFHPLRFPWRDRLFELHARGLSVQNIARELNLRASVVRKVIEAPQVQKVLEQAQVAVMKDVR